MELLAGNAQLAGVQLGKFRATGKLRITNKTPDRLGRAVQRFFQFLQDPGQGAEVIARKLVVTGGGCIRLHGFVHSREWRGQAGGFRRS